MNTLWLKFTRKGYTGRKEGYHARSGFSKSLLNFLQNPRAFLSLLLRKREISSNPLFDSDFYVKYNHDCLNGLSAVEHFILYGWKEGRDPGPEFSIRYYLQQNPDVADSGMNPLVHYMRHGLREGRQCNDYREQYERVERSRLFDRSYYLTCNPDVAASGTDPLRHFLRFGWREGRNPSRIFNLKGYAEKHPEVLAPPQNPLLHALDRIDPRMGGASPSRRPEQEFTGDFAIFNVSAEEAEGIIRSSGYFDEAYYLGRNRDVKDAGVDPVSHFYHHGWKEYRNPSTRFNTFGYMSGYPEVAASRVNPLLYFLLKGRRESHDPCRRLEVPEIAEEEVALIKEKLAGCSTPFSVVMPAYNRAAVICSAIDSVLRQSYPHFELIISDDGSSDGTVAMLSDRYGPELASGRMLIIENNHKGVSAARNAGLRHARGEWIAYLDSDNSWHPHYLLFVAHAFVSNRERRNCYARMEVIDRIGDRHFIAGQAFSLAEIRRRNFIDLNVYAHHRCLYEALGGFDESLTRLVDWDMINRHVSCYRPMQIERVLARYHLDPALSNITSRVGLQTNRDRVYAKIDACRNQRIAIKVPAPDLAQAPEWGDYHLALALQRELISAGYLVRVDTIDDWYEPECASDRIVIVFRGLSEYVPDPSHINILWLISHPNDVPRSELQKYDLVLVASEKYAEKISGLDIPPVQVMEQFTDPKMFTPSKSDLGRDIDLLFVGNSRGVYRRIVKDCIELGYEVAVFGSRWEDFIDGRYIKGRHIPNHLLHHYYSNAKIVLNDHWPDMVEHGFVSNRIYDVAASGGFVISDHNAAFSHLFGDSIITYSNPKDLKQKIEHYLKDRPARQLKCEQLRSRVLRFHTAKSRSVILAKTLQKLLEMRSCYEKSDEYRRRNEIILQGSIPAESDSLVSPVYEEPLRLQLKALDTKVMAWYLPQYYPFEENDRFWGPGFTDWDNVRKARPVYRGHYQPKIPGDMKYHSCPKQKF